MLCRDMPSKGALGEAYKRVAACTGGDATQLLVVLKDEFTEAGSDLEDVAPSGWSPVCPDLERCATPAGRCAVTTRPPQSRHSGVHAGRTTVLPNHGHPKQTSRVIEEQRKGAG